jgi:hypothetical protein
MQRVDLYGECNVVGAPVEAFAEECCKHCINPECTRSAFGKTKFDQRVSTWVERFFTQVPRMDQGDPRFEKISAQRFLAINQALTVNSAWVDPRDLSENLPVPAPSIIVAPPPPAPIVEPEPLLIMPPTAPANKNPTLTLPNTPVKQGQMLQPPVGAPTPAKSWDSPPATTDTAGVRVVKSGAKVKLGGSV